MQGQDVVQDFTDTALIVMPKDYTSPKIACAGHGTATFAADGSMTISLTEITPFGTCPGQAAVDSTYPAHGPRSSALLRRWAELGA
jgi:hypothetical protein